MLYIKGSAQTHNNGKLCALRRRAKARGFRIVRGYPNWSLVDARLEPQRRVLGLSACSLAQIEAALAALPPQRKPGSTAFRRVPAAIMSTLVTNGAAP
jgi:hypothetical protein